MVEKFEELAEAHQPELADRFVEEDAAQAAAVAAFNSSPRSNTNSPVSTPTPFGVTTLHDHGPGLGVGQAQIELDGGRVDEESQRL